MHKADRGSSEEDLKEFGDAELAGSPSIAKLIAVMPEDKREDYRKERREVLLKINPNFKTWREYFF